MIFLVKAVITFVVHLHNVSTDLTVWTCIIKKIRNERVEIMMRRVTVGADISNDRTDSVHLVMFRHFIGDMSNVDRKYEHC